MTSERPRPDRCGARCTRKTGLEFTTTRTDSNGELPMVRHDDIAAVRLRSTDGTAIVEGPPEYRLLRQYYWSEYDIEAICLEKDVSPEDVGYARPGEDDDVHPIAESVSAGANYIDPRSEASIPTGPNSDRFPQIGRRRPAYGSELPPNITYDDTDLDRLDARTKSLLEANTGGGKLWWIVVADTEAEIYHHDTELVGYCEKFPLKEADNGRCRHHGGYSDGEFRDGQYTPTHGLAGERSNYYSSLGHEGKIEIESLVNSWLDDAPFDRDHRAKMTELFRIAIDQYRLWASQEQYASEGMVIENTVGVDPETGEEQTAADENPMNLAYDRLDSRVYSKLDKLGILGDSEGEDQSVEISLAQKLSGLADE